MQYAIAAALVGLLAILVVIAGIWRAMSFSGRIDRRARRRQRFMRAAEKSRTIIDQTGPDDER